MKLAIVGLGLIGGSLATSLRNRKFCSEVYGVDIDKSHGDKALSIGFIDEFLPLSEAINKADVIAVAIPVDKAKAVVLEILDQLSEGKIVFDMGSTKSGVCSEVLGHPKRNQFVASHPIAGTENSGPEAAIDNLFDGKITIICDEKQSDSAAVKSIEDIYSVLNMKIIKMESEEHDRHIAYVSHLSHISSFVLGQTVLEMEKDEKNIFNMAGSGFESTVRLAKSSPDMWSPIFDQNKEHLSKALETYISNLLEFKKNIDEGNAYETYKLMSKVNDIRRVLNGIKPADDKK